MSVLLRVSFAAALCTLPFAMNGESPSSQLARSERQQQLDASARGDACRAQGFQPNEVTGECTDIPLRPLYR